MIPLSQRKQEILRALVEEYIHSAIPVASETLVRKYHLNFSSATVRHELAGLEEAHLIYQPHTSAGRVPTDLGYRYFVEYLMQESALSLNEQRLIRHQFYQVQDQLDQWVRLTASVMARLLHSAAVMTSPRANVGYLKHFEVLSVTDLAAHLVLVLRDGTVKQQRLLLEASIDQEELSVLAARLNKLFQEKNAIEVEALLGKFDFSPIERLIATTIARILEQHGDPLGDVFYRDGVVNILEQPEYSRMGPEEERNERVRKVMEVLERSRALETEMTALLGALMCPLQRNLKRLLAFSTVAHVGIFIMGVALLTPVGLDGAAFYILTHAPVKAALFLCVGILWRRFDSVDEHHLRGRGRDMVGTGLLFALGGLSLAGLPPLTMFLGKGMIEREGIAIILVRREVHRAVLRHQGGEFDLQAPEVVQRPDRRQRPDVRLQPGSIAKLKHISMPRR